MAAGKEIRGKIKSVENTKKITKAMEMVAASKMRKAQERMRAARPYSEKIRNIAANLGQANPEYVHAFMKTNDAKTSTQTQTRININMHKPHQSFVAKRFFCSHGRKEMHMLCPQQLKVEIHLATGAAVCKK